MADAAGTIGKAGFPRLRRLGDRPEGLTVQEVMEEFSVKYGTALRYVLRAVRDGILKRTDERRRRAEVFGKAARGAGGVVYRTTRAKGERSPWDDWRSWQRRRA
jgi:hypothetical protein